MEIRCLLRKRRQIEVCDEGTEGGERGKEEQQKMRLFDEAVICYPAKFMRKDAILGKIRIEYIDNLLLFLNS